MKHFKHLNRFAKYLLKYWKVQAVVTFFGIVTIPMTLLNPYLTKIGIDKAYGHKDMKLFLILVLIGASAFILNGIITTFTGYLSNYINRNINFDLTLDVFKKLQRVPLSFFSNRTTGEHIYKLHADVRTVGDFVCNVTPQLIITIPKLIFLICLVFSLNYKMALFSILLVPITYIQPFVFGKWMRELQKKTVLKAQGIYTELQEVFSHIHLIKALGKEKQEIGKFEENLSKRRELELQNAKVSNIGGFSNSVLGKIVSGLIGLYGGYNVIKGTITLGSLTAIMIYLKQMTGLLKSLGQTYQTIVVNSISRNRLAELIDQPEEKTAENPQTIDSIKQGIEFKNVVFSYDGKEKVIDGLNFKILKGDKIALIGGSGTGKTTMLSLLLGLYEASDGKISIDGIEISEIEKESFRSKIGIVLQEPFLWNDTIKNNMLYGKPKATDEEIYNAARITCIDTFIDRFFDKYDANIGEMACKISEGQKQRIALARAIIHKPQLIILDEALSNVDSETEEKIINNLKSYLKEAIVITVSHRLSTVRKMDKIYFLENKKTVTIGTHEDLLLKNAKYRELFVGQL